MKHGRIRRRRQVHISYRGRMNGTFHQRLGRSAQTAPVVYRALPRPLRRKFWRAIDRHYRESGFIHSAGGATVADFVIVEVPVLSEATP